jgi:sulfate-transporting ATPase
MIQGIVQFFILGLGSAAVYALLAQGVVLIYQGSGVVNFAHAAFALVGAITYYELEHSGWPAIWALAASILAGAALGALVQGIVMRRLMTAAPIVRVIATLGVLVTIESAAALHYQGDNVLTVPQFLPQHTWHIGRVFVLSADLVLFGIAVCLTVVLGVLQRVWLPAIAVRAAAENELAASTFGWSPAALAMGSWFVGGALAGLAGALLLPLTGLSIEGIIELTVPALAAALLARFDSFAIALGGAAVIGISQSEVLRFWSQQGATTAVPLLLVMVILVLSGRALPLRGYLTDRLPSIGSGIVRPRTLAAVIPLLGLLVIVLPGAWQSGIAIWAAVAVIILSVVVLTGYAGQISLGQYAVGGFGAYVAGRIVATQGVPFWVGFIAGIPAAALMGLIFALPALRTRGVNLAIITLGLAVAINSLLFNNFAYTGGTAGTPVGTPSLFGLNISAVDHPGRYAAFGLALFVLVALGVAKLRRGRGGRRMIAIRQSERGAASLGVSVAWTKAHAFALAAAIAATGCCLLAFSTTSINFPQIFDPFNSIFAIGWGVIGGIGYIVGPLLGATLAPGGPGTVIGNTLLNSVNQYLSLIGGIAVIAILMLNPDGLASLHAAQLRWLRRAVSAKLRRRPAEAEFADDERHKKATAESVRTVAALSRLVEPKTLHVTNLTVRFGGVAALADLNFDVDSGAVVGLIGPNGAGKTTFLDAVTGFVSPTSGTIRLGGKDITRVSAHRRARLGVARSWQSLELFDEISVLENLLIPVDSARHATTGVKRGSAVTSLSPHAAGAVTDFDLFGDLDRSPAELPYGRRRLVGVARTIALGPSVILLDEPAAGLSREESDELGVHVRRLATTCGMAVVLVEHDVDLVMSICDQVVVLNYGVKIAEGTPDSVRRDPAVVAAYLGSPSTAASASATVAVPGHPAHEVP